MTSCFTLNNGKYFLKTCHILHRSGFKETGPLGKNNGTKNVTDTLWKKSDFWKTGPRRFATGKAERREAGTPGPAGLERGLLGGSHRSGVQTYFSPEKRATSIVPARACRWSCHQHRHRSCPPGRCSPGAGHSPRPADRSGRQEPGRAEAAGCRALGQPPTRTPRSV